jgi:hypothetical protein
LYQNLEVIEYAPKVFRKLRHLEGISENEIIQSLNLELNREVIEESKGKSGSIMITTFDNNLIFKTLKKEEFDKIFSDFLIFYSRFIEKHPNSLICRIYGIYSIRPTREANPNLIILCRNAIGIFEKVNSNLKTFP